MTSEATSSSSNIPNRKLSKDVLTRFSDTIEIEVKDHPLDGTSDLGTMNKVWIHSKADISPIFIEQLKYGKDTTDGHQTRKRGSIRPKKLEQKSRKRLSFDEEVKIFPIPTRHEYSRRVRAKLWSSAEEIEQNAARNTLEFAFEGWNWKSVLEDDRMYVCLATSELIHPCHYVHHYIHGFR
eukprot:scaffold2830_cov131-Cylindrotheca_fusiformis.AAC.1